MADGDLTVKMGTDHADALLGLLGIPVPQQTAPPNLMPGMAASTPPAPPDVPASPLPPIPQGMDGGMPPPGPPGSVDYASRKLNTDISRPQPGLLGKIGGWATSILTPGIASMIPQTPLGRIVQQNQDREQLGQAESEERADRQESSEELQRQAAIDKSQTDTEATKAGMEMKTITGPDGTEYSVPLKDAEKLQVALASQAGATARESSKEGTQKDIATGKETTAEDIAKQRTEAQQNIAKAHDLVSSENARIRASSADDPDKLTTMMKTQKQQAQATLPQIDKALDETEQVAGSLGPTAGRWNDFWQGKVGASDPAFAHYKDEIGMISTAVTLAHARGRMSNELFEHFQKMFDAGKQAPENMIQALNVAKEWLGTYAHMGEPGSGVGEGTKPAGGAPPARPTGVPADAKWNQDSRTWTK